MLPNFGQNLIELVSYAYVSRQRDRRFFALLTIPKWIRYIDILIDNDSKSSRISIVLHSRLVGSVYQVYAYYEYVGTNRRG